MKPLNCVLEGVSSSPSAGCSLRFGESLSVALFLTRNKENKNSSFLLCYCLYAVEASGCLFQAGKFPALLMNLDIKAERM